MGILRHIIRALVAVVVLCVISPPVFAGALDGMVFKGTTGDMNKAGSEKDVIRFENGRFYSDGCAEWGFGGGEYLIKGNGKYTHFIADTFSEKEGKISWVGTISGNKLDAVYIWYKNEKFENPELIKWFKGKAK